MIKNLFDLKFYLDRKNYKYFYKAFTKNSKFVIKWEQVSWKKKRNLYE